MAISWTKLFSSTDDGNLITGAQIGTMQADIAAGVAGSLPTPGTTDGLKVPRVLSDHSGYELISQIPIVTGGTGADLSVGTSGYAVISQGTATAFVLSPLYHVVQVSFLLDSTAQTSYCVSPVTGVVSACYVNNFLAARGATYTVANGSVGVTIATATVASTGVAGQVTTMTLGTVAITAGGSIGVTRAAQGTTGASMVSIVIIKTP